MSEQTSNTPAQLNLELETKKAVDLSQFAPSPKTELPAPTPTPSRLKWLLLFLTCCFLGLLIAGGLYARSIYQKVSISADTPTVVATPNPTPDPFRPQSFLLMGYGGGGHEGGKLTDTIMLAYIQPKLERVDLISIPRDLWVSFPVNGETESYWKLNAAYALGSDDRNYPNKLPQYTGAGGGGELAKYAVTKITGLPIDHYAVVDFYSFQKAIDVLGGITVDVERSFDDYKYPIAGEEDNTCEKTEEEVIAVTATLSGQKLEDEFPCRYEHLHFDAGPTVMDGETALKYVRSRHSAVEGGDFNRAARQRQLLLGVKEKVFTINFLPKAIPFINSLSNDFHTDLDLGNMTEILSKINEWKNYEIRMTALTTDNILQLGVSSNGQSILIPKAGQDNWPALQAWLQTQLSDQTGEPEATTSAENASQI